jgi:hypothetical protein
MNLYKTETIQKDAMNLYKMDTVPEDMNLYKNGNISRSCETV